MCIRNSEKHFTATSTDMCISNSEKSLQLPVNVYKNDKNLYSYKYMCIRNSENL